MGRQIARLTLETTPGVFPTGTIPAANQVLLDLPISNALTVRAVPEPIVLRSAAGGNRRIKTTVNRKPVRGDLTAHLRPTQAGFFLNVLANIAAEGQCFNLPTFAIDHAIFLHDGNCTPVVRRYLGCMATGSISGASEGDAQMLMVKLSIFGRGAGLIDTTLFPVPALSDYDAADPYQLHDTAGHLVIKGVRANYKNFTVDFKNIIKPFPDEGAYYGNVGWFGRDPSLSATLLLKSDQDRLDFESATPIPMSLAIDDGTTTTSLEFQANNVISDVADDLPLDDFFTQAITVQNMLDLAAGTDLSYAVAPTTAP